MMRLFRLTYFALFLGFTLAPSASAEVFIELFTAKSCDVCVEAENIVEELAQSENVIAVAMHVDYWDYVEKDPLAHPAFGARQVGYNKIGNLKELFTPQIVFQGEEKEASSDFEAMFQVIDNYTSDNPIEVNTAPEAGAIDISIEPMKKKPERQLEVIWMRFYSEEELKTQFSDERASEETSVHQVKLIRTIDEWSGTETFTAKLELETPAQGVLIVQESGLGKVLFAKIIEVDAP